MFGYEDAEFARILVVLVAPLQVLASWSYGQVLMRFWQSSIVKGIAFVVTMPMIIGVVFIQIRIYRKFLGFIHPISESRFLLILIMFECLISLLILLRSAARLKIIKGTQK